MKTRKSLNAFISILLLATFTFVSAGCETSPTGRHRFATSDDPQIDQMGVQAFTEMKSKDPIDSDAKRDEYVKCVANAITSALPEKRDWEVVVFKTKEANAFALPGGKIGVNTGLLSIANSPGQLAAVLGHEVSHVLAHHSQERMIDQQLIGGAVQAAGLAVTDKDSPKYKIGMAALGLGAQYGLLMPFSRAQEAEADVMGLDLMARAGFNPTEAVALWQNMDAKAGAQPPQFMSDHPSNSSRIAMLQSKLPEAIQTYKQSTFKPNCRP